MNIRIVLFFAAFSLVALSVQAQKAGLSNDIDRKGLRKALKAYHQENIDPVMSAKRAELEPYINAEDRAELARIRTELREKRADHRAARQARKESGERPAPRAKRQRSQSDNPSQLAVKDMLSRYDEPITELLASLEQERATWKSDIADIVNSYLPEDMSAAKKKEALSKHRRAPALKDTPKRYFLLMEPSK